MAGPISRLRSFIRNWFTRKCVAVDDMPLASAQITTRKGKRGALVVWRLVSGLFGL